MPKQKSKESEEEQSERFRNAVSDAAAAGELYPTDADEALDKLVRKDAVKQIGSIADVG